MRRQLGMEVPAGFRADNQWCRQLREFYTTQDLPVSDLSSISSVDNPTTLNALPLEDSIDNSINRQDLDPPTITTDTSLTHIPILRCVDKPSTSLPSRVMLTEDIIHASVGFRCVDTIKKHLSSLYQDTIILDKLPPDAVLDMGDLATIHKVNRNTTPVPRPPKFADVIHMDIVFGPDISVGNIHYGLLLTDRYSRMTYIYPLKNLSSDIVSQLEAFFAHLGLQPKRLISDFDTKLIGGKARTFLKSLKIHVNAAPANHQERNGLVERHWQTMVAMARNWLASAELPASFWYYAVKRAAEVCNYFPIKLDSGQWSTPLELAHQCKPDLRVLFKLFSLAAVRQFEAQSTPMIAVGICPVSNGHQFYNPSNGTFVSSIDYKFQTHVTSGAHFGLKYQPGTFLYRLDESTSIFDPQFPIDSSVHVHTLSPPSLAKIIGMPTYQHPDIYTVAFKDGSIAEYMSDILSLAPSDLPPTSSTILPSWIKGGANATLFLLDMSKPKHGKVNISEDNVWQFYPRKSDKGIILPDLMANCQHLMDTGQLFRGHAKFKNVYDTRNQLSLKDCVLRHVSAPWFKITNCSNLGEKSL